MLSTTDKTMSLREKGFSTQGESLRQQGFSTQGDSRSSYDRQDYSENNLPKNDNYENQSFMEEQQLKEIREKYTRNNPIKPVQRQFGDIEREYDLPDTYSKKLREPDSAANMVVVYDEMEKKFTIYNSNKSILGSFTFKQIVKYIGKQSCPDFLQNFETGYSDELIKTLIGEVTSDPVTKKLNITLKSHLDSPFMGNLDLLIRLNNSFYSYESGEINTDLIGVPDEKTQYAVKMSIKQFIYLLINHTLKIISIATDDIKNDPSQAEMKQKLLKYSVALTYRISNFMKEHLDNYNNQYKSLYSQLEKLISMKTSMNQKINNLEQKINQQNNYIFEIINGKPPTHTAPQLTTEKDFEKLFSNDKDKNNFYDSEAILDNQGETYLLTDNENSDVSLII
jgi:hypothetical protein